MAFKYSKQSSSPVYKSKVKSLYHDVHQMNAINNNVLRASPRRQANQFIEWYKNLIDNDRTAIGMYMADDSIFQWFGKTVKTKKKICHFLRYDMHCTDHSFSAVEATGPITVRGETESHRKKINFDDSFEDLATPLDGDPAEVKPISKLFGIGTKRSRRPSSSPEWEAGKSPGTKKAKKVKKNEPSPKVIEMGQGDSIPSTSKKRAVDVDMDYISKLPRFYLEARCIIEFMRTRNKRGAEVMKWERQCKVQIGYSEDPMNAGEYIVWTVVYSDNNRCRRNLLAEFDALANQESAKI